MKKYKYLSFALVFLFTFTSLTQVVFAAETRNEKIARLQKEYGIVIAMDEAVFNEYGGFRIVKSNVKGIPKEWVESLEAELSCIPKELNKYVVKNVDKPLTIRFLAMHESMGDGFFVLGAEGLYTAGNNTIYLMCGMPGSLVHEYGHMLDYYFFQNSKEFYPQWKKFNGGAVYGSDYDSLTEKQKKAFIDTYAMTNIHEDIAVTFDTLVYDSVTDYNGNYTGGFAKKTEYLENFIEELVDKNLF